MAHLCHAHDCASAVPPRMLMCRHHWFSLPRAVRDAIWHEYRPGQERTKDPSDRYLAVFWFAVAQTAPEGAARAANLSRSDRRRWRAVDAGLGDPLADAGLAPHITAPIGGPRA